MLSFLRSLISSNRSSKSGQEKGTLDTNVDEAVSRASEILKDLGFEPEEVRTSYENYKKTDLEQGKTIESYIKENDKFIYSLEPDENVPIAVIVEDIIRYSDRGVYTDFSYGEDQVQRKLSAAFPEGYSIRLEDLEGHKLGYWKDREENYYVEEGDTFRAILKTENEERSTDFSYPEDHYGKSSFDRLVKQVNKDLLIAEDFSIYQFKRFGDYWEFAVLKDREAKRFKDKYGSESQIADQTLIEFDF
ncbi:MAG: hypothetical protein H8Z69_01330 [Nanohaloarchaea archaeon]|nr:hypothetical protein [Candidatus Nanohaloarchaea archaeon]